MCNESSSLEPFLLVSINSPPKHYYHISICPGYGSRGIGKAIQIGNEKIPGDTLPGLVGMGKTIEQ